MPRNDGKDYTVARNSDLLGDKVDAAQGHNERENDTYSNPDIIPERTAFNVHFKSPTAGYTEMFDQMVKEGTISTRGLKADATHFCEMVLDVNSAYFFNHGGYEFAKKFYADAYQAAAEIIGGEQYILSAVMHADERNKAISEALGQDVYHYHMHIVYVPVVEKQILWSKRCKDPALRGTIKETIMQVSRSKKWASQPVLDENGEPLLSKNGKPILRPSYSVLQDQFYDRMRAAGYDDIERGQRSSTEEHLTVTQFKVQQEQQRLADVQAEIAQLGDEKEQAIEDVRAAQERLHVIASRVKDVEQKYVDLLHDANKHLPEAGMLESAKAYREKKVMPFIKRMQKIYLALYRKFVDLKSELDALKQQRNQEAYRWEEQARKLQRECQQLRPEATNFRKVQRMLGTEKVEQLLSTPETIPQHFTDPSRDR